MKFYIQKNISEKDVNELVEVFTQLSIEYELFYHIPFDDSYPPIDKNKKAFVYAASSVTDKVFMDNENFSGVFAHTNKIKLSDYFKTSQELMWNIPLYMGAFKNYEMNEEEIFIRPLIDSKWLAGTVLNKEEYIEWVEKLSKIDFDFNEEIFVAKINQPQNEYRLFFVNQEYSTGSQYKKDFELFKSRNIPIKIIEIAKEFLEKNKSLLPNSFVVDVGVKEDKIGIIEVNGINNAGFYDIDKKKLIEDLINN